MKRVLPTSTDQAGNRWPRAGDDPRRAKACAEKVRYPSEAAARAVGQASIRRVGGLARLWPYACPVCRGWHLTKWPAEGMAAITADALREVGHG